MSEAFSNKRPTASQEDYLEAIWALIWRDGVARVGDIAEWLGVSMSSVTGALKGLSQRRLVEYKPHKYVKLTDRGMELAEGISARHQMLRRFLTDVLGMKEELADRNACRIEHAVDDVVSQRLTWFVEFVSENPQGKQWVEQFSAYCAQMRAASGPGVTGTGVCETPIASGKERGTMTLADVKPGRRAKVIRVNVTAETNRRLAVMGVTRDEVLSVVRIAPLGDPIEVKVRGYSLSLRKGQARGIEVEELE